MKLTVIFRDDAPVIHCGSSPTYRTVQVALTDEQKAKLQTRKGCTTESISMAIIEQLDAAGRGEDTNGEE
jgi:hypothetical protein